jgi:hypothetical protein
MNGVGILEIVFFASVLVLSCFFVFFFDLGAVLFGGAGWVFSVPISFVRGGLVLFYGVLLW